jgi:hypothetical protein
VNKVAKSNSGVDIDFDPSQVRVNFSEEEASSEAFDFEPLPTGKYLCAITEVETRFSNSEKNKGKPYWALTLTVQEGPFEGRKVWANVMLFDGALYSLAQLMKAINRADVLQTGQIPSVDELLGEKMIATIRKMRDKYKEEKDGSNTVYFKNEVGGFKPLSDAVASASGGNSLLP